MHSSFIQSYLQTQRPDLQSLKTRFVNISVN